MRRSSKLPPLQTLHPLIYHFLPDGSYVTQSVHLTAGYYRLGFNLGSDGGSPAVSVSLGGTSLGSFGTGSQEVDFTIGSEGDYTLEFDDSGGYGELGGVDIWEHTTVDYQSILVASQRIETSYNALGQVDTVTSYDEASSGNITSQVQRTYNGFGQLTAEYQQHGGSVNTSTSLATRYGYDSASDIFRAEIFREA